MPRRSILDMLGEFAREAGVLVLVFGFLERWARGVSPDTAYTAWVVGISLSLLFGGIAIERLRGGLAP